MYNLNYKFNQLGITDRQFRILSDKVKKFVEDNFDVIPNIKESFRKSFPKVKDELQLIFHTIDNDFIDDEFYNERRRIIEAEIRNYKISKLLGENFIYKFSEFNKFF
jgi:SMC interacting uncharacterized protein involved in chromosome segregation